MPSIADLRNQLQLPYRRHNDLGGILFGDWVSIYLTWLFIRLDIGPTPASVFILVFGLAGALLLLGGGVWSVIGALFLILSYISDCVDGEVARYRECESHAWAFHDLFFGIYVKTAFYLVLGIYAAAQTGVPAMFGLGLAAALATLFSQFLGMAPIYLTARDAYMRSHRDHTRIRTQLAAYQQLKQPQSWLQTLRDDNAVPVPTRWEVALRYGLPFGLPRALVGNYDLMMLVFLALATLDLFIPAQPVAGVPVDGKIAFIAFFGVFRPTDFLFNVIRAVSSGWFHNRSRQFMMAAEALNSASTETVQVHHRREPQTGVSPAEIAAERNQ